MSLAFHEFRPVSALQVSLLAAQIQRVTDDVQALLLGRPASDLQACLEPGSWSVAECLDHLAQTARAFLPAMTDAINAAPRLATNRRLRTGVLAGLFIRNLEPPYRVRFKVLPQLKPQCQSFEVAWRGFEDSQTLLLQTVGSVSGLAIDTVKIKSPVYARIHYNVYGAIRMLIAHERRHLWQIEHTLRKLDARRASRSAA